MKIEAKTLPYWLSVVIAVWVWSAVILFSTGFFLFGLIVVAFFSYFIDRGTRRLLHLVAVYWAKMAMAINPLWRIKVQGAKKVERGKNYLIVANHQSLLDILLVLSSLPTSLHFKFLAKKELFPIPFFGWHMSLAGYIPIDRSSPESRKQIMEIVRQWLRKGVSVLFFPEGTRSLDGEIHLFKIGAFKLAREENVEILPIVIEGTRDALPKKSWRMEKKSPFFLSIGAPVNLKKCKDKKIEQIRDDIQQEMTKRLKHIRGLMRK